MFPNVQSIFLQSLGHAIANSFWQMAGIWLLFMVLNIMIRFTAAMKYRLAVLAQVAGFVWFIGSFVRHYLPVAAPISMHTTVYTGLSGLLNKTSGLLPYLSLVYLLMMAFLAVKWILGYRHTRIIETRGLKKMPAEWRLFIKKIAFQLSVKKEVRIFLSEHISTPLTTGFLKPIILVPLASINHLTTEQLEAVLLHEMAHIKRQDYLVNIILSLVELVLFFNPFTYLISKEIHQERENSCDDWVLQFRYDASEYAQALLRIASIRIAPSFAMAAAGNKQALLFRVKRMIGQEKRTNHRSQVIVLLVAGALIFTSAWLFPKNGAAIKKQQRILSNLETTASQKPVLVVVRQEAPAQTRVLPTVVVTSIKKMRVKEPEPAAEISAVNAPFISPAGPAPQQPLLAETDGILALPTDVHAPGKQLILADDPDKAMVSLNNIDIEKLLDDVFRSTQFTEDDKKEFGKLRRFLLSDRNPELLKTELREKQNARLQTGDITSVSFHNADRDPQQLRALHVAPLVMKVSFTINNPDEARQVARIKLAILNQLRFIIQNKIKRDLNEEVILR